MDTLAHVIRDGLALSVIITSMTVTQTLANMEEIALLEKKLILHVQSYVLFILHRIKSTVSHVVVLLVTMETLARLI